MRKHRAWHAAAVATIAAALLLAACHRTGDGGPAGASSPRTGFAATSS